MIRNTASQKIQVFAYDYSTGAPKTGDAANLTAYLKKDSGAITALTDTSATEVSSTNAPGWYEFDISQTETNAVDLLVTGKSSTSNVVVVGFRTATVPPNFSTLTIDASNRVDASVGNVQNGINGLQRAGTSQAVSATTLTMDAAAAYADNALIGNQVKLTSGTNIGATAIITGSVGSTDVVTFSGGWSNGATPTGTPTFEIWGTAPGASLAQMATAIWQDTTAGDFTTVGSIGKSLFTSGAVPGAAGGHFIAGTNAATTITTGLTTTFTGNLTGSVASVTGAVGSVTGSVGGNVAGSVGSVTGAVGSVTGAVGSVTGNVGGNVVGSIGSLAAQAKADVNAEVVDTLVTDTYAQPLTVPAATSSLKDKINWFFTLSRNKINQTATTQTLRNDGDSADIASTTLSDNGVTGVRGKFL